MKKLMWLADSRASVKRFPASVLDDIGYALYIAQLGEANVRSKPLHGLVEQAAGKGRLAIFQRS
jgi:phage-related protein